MDNSLAHPPKSSEERRLDKLLDDEYYLLLILAHLVDDGLHECRRVCRKWYKVCNELPMRIRVPEEKISLALDRFPNATAVSGVKDCRDEASEIAQRSDLQGVDLSASWLSCLSQLRRVQSLKLKFRYLAFSSLETLHLRPLLDESLECRQMCQQLCALEISLPLDLIEKMDLFSGLRNLTNLTKLALFNKEYLSEEDFLMDNLSIEPFTELRKIEDLHILMLTNSENRLMFPALTNLTRLYFDEVDFHKGRCNGRVLEVTSPVSLSNSSFCCVRFSYTMPPVFNQFLLIHSTTTLRSQTTGNC